MTLYPTASNDIRRIMAEANCLFLDIGGVLLNNGWDRQMRKRAAQYFTLDYEELNERHHLIFDSYEKGHLSLDGYLDRILFYQERHFSRAQFKDFMFAQSQAYPQMIMLIRQLKEYHQFKTVAVSNEGRELNAHRICSFGLAGIIDFFVSSCYVHLRKLDLGIFQMALDMAQVNPQQVIYLDDREMFIDVAQSLGIRSILHCDFEITRTALAELGLDLDNNPHKESTK